MHPDHWPRPSGPVQLHCPAWEWQQFRRYRGHVDEISAAEHVYPESLAWKLVLKFQIPTQGRGSGYSGLLFSYALSIRIPVPTWQYITQQ